MINIENEDIVYSDEDKQQTSHKAKQQLKICKICSGEVAKGKHHNCKQSNAHKNVLKTIENLPESQQDQIVHRLLIQKANSSKKSNIEISLKTAGNGSKVIINPIEKPPLLFTEEKLDNFMINTGSSLQQMEKMTNFLRSTTGKKSVPAYYKKHATNITKSLDQLYKCEMFKFDIEKSTEKQTRPVIFADAEELLNVILEKREEHQEVYVKVLADGGQGFFKISLQILPKHSTEDDDDEDEETPKAKRSRYSEGGAMGKKANLNGVKRLIMLCLVPNIKETYENVKLLVDLIKLNNISFKFATDFKLMLIVIGQQTGTSQYPCPYCLVCINEMRTGDCGSHLEFGIEGNEEILISEECLKLKTFGDLRKSFQSFSEMGSDKKKAKLCQSTINEPLLTEDDDMCIIEKILIPELHEVQGIVNYIFWKGLVPLLGRENALKFPTKLNLISKDYHGQIFEGNPCRVMVKNADVLYNQDILGEVPFLKIVPFVETLKSFDKLIKSCFTTNKVESDWKMHLNELKKNYLATELPVTLKVHVLFEHLDHGLFFLDDYGLGLFSEQAGESVHREFLNSWMKFKINLIDSPNYAENLRKAVVDFSSRHI